MGKLYRGEKKGPKTPQNNQQNGKQNGQQNGKSNDNAISAKYEDKGSSEVKEEPAREDKAEKEEDKEMAKKDKKRKREGENKESASKKTKSRDGSVEANDTSLDRPKVSSKEQKKVYKLAPKKDKEDKTVEEFLKELKAESLLPAFGSLKVRRGEDGEIILYR